MNIMVIFFIAVVSRYLLIMIHYVRSMLANYAAPTLHDEEKEAK
jgi:hypothetical protein